MAPTAFISAIKRRSLPSDLLRSFSESSMEVTPRPVLGSGIHPVLVLCITFLLFVLMLVMALAFSLWQWRRARLYAYEKIEAPAIRPGDLYYRRVERNRRKQVRWQTLVVDEIPTSSATAATRLLSNHSTRVHPPTSQVSYGSIAGRIHRLGDIPPPYSPHHPGLYYDYTNLPSATTTIDSAVTDRLTPPPVPRRSSLRRQPQLNLMISTPEMQHVPMLQAQERHPTPYPLPEQLTPSPVSTSITPISQNEAPVITLQLPVPRHNVPSIMLSPGRTVSSSPGEVTPVKSA